MYSKNIYFFATFGKQILIFLNYRKACKQKYQQKSIKRRFLKKIIGPAFRKKKTIKNTVSLTIV